MVLLQNTIKSEKKGPLKILVPQSSLQSNNMALRSLRTLSFTRSPTQRRAYLDLQVQIYLMNWSPITFAGDLQSLKKKKKINRNTTSLNRKGYRQYSIKRGLWTPPLPVVLTGIRLTKALNFHVHLKKHKLSFMKKESMTQKAKTREEPRNMKNYSQVLSHSQETANLTQIGFQNWYIPVIPIYLPFLQ